MQKPIKNAKQNTIIIDGFPRSKEQLEALENLLSNSKDIVLQRVIEVVVSEEIAMQRVLGRNRGDDDKIEVFKHRMSVYNEPLAIIEKFYEDKGVLVKVDGSKDIKNVVNQIKESISEFL